MTGYDVIVVGAGLAGLAAAATLAAQDAHVLVLDKEQTGSGSSGMSGGWFAWSGTPEQHQQGIEDDEETFVRDMLATGGGQADPQLLQAYVDHQRETDAWARSQLGTVYDVVTLSAGQSVPRSHHTDIATMLDRLRDLASGVEFHHGCGAAELLEDADGRVVGVAHQSGQSGARYGVILASGGFSRSTDLLNRFAPRQLTAIPHGGEGNTGDGLLMAETVGADLRDTEYVSATFGSHPQTSSRRHELLTAFYLGAVIVNQRGERFVDESLPYKQIGDACLDQPGAIGYQVFDQRVRERSRSGVPLSDIDALQHRLLHAATLPALAELAAIDPERLNLTVHRYNQAVNRSRKDDFGRTALCNGVGGLTPLATPPFYAYPSRPLMTSTFGGLRVSPTTRVLHRDGHPIPGLYAAGEVTGGFHGTSYLTGTALGKALIFGRQAGLRVLP